MKISYLITCCSERETLDRLLEKLYKTIDINKDEIIILMDTMTASWTVEIIEKHTGFKIESVRIDNKKNKSTDLSYKDYKFGNKAFAHDLNNDYGSHKNYGIEKCKGDFIMQLDGDELPPDSLLGENLHELIESNPSIEAYAIPRLNVFNGVTDAEAIRWGWRLTPSKSIILEKTLDTNSSEYKFLKKNGYIIEEMETH